MARSGGFSAAELRDADRSRFIGEGEGIHCPDLYEDISVEGSSPVGGRAKTQACLKRWLESRQAG